MSHLLSSDTSSVTFSVVASAYNTTRFEANEAILCKLLSDFILASLPLFSTMCSISRFNFITQKQEAEDSSESDLAAGTDAADAGFNVLLDFDTRFGVSLDTFEGDEMETNATVAQAIDIFVQTLVDYADAVDPTYQLDITINHPPPPPPPQPPFAPPPSPGGDDGGGTAAHRAGGIVLAIVLGVVFLTGGVVSLTLGFPILAACCLLVAVGGVGGGAAWAALAKSEPAPAPPPPGGGFPYPPPSPPFPPPSPPLPPRLPNLNPRAPPPTPPTPPAPPANLSNPSDYPILGAVTLCNPTVPPQDSCDKKSYMYTCVEDTWAPWTRWCGCFGWDQVNYKCGKNGKLVDTRERCNPYQNGWAAQPFAGLDPHTGWLGCIDKFWSSEGLECHADFQCKSRTCQTSWPGKYLCKREGTSILFVR